MSYDALVIGAGINGLTAAAYLAKAGRRVLVLERREVIGGVAATEELIPGFRFDTCLHDVGWIPPRLIRELALERHGLELLRPEVALFAPLRDGGGVVITRDAAGTADSLRTLSAADAERWSAFQALMSRLAGVLEAIYDAAPPRPTSARPRDLFSLARLGLRVRSLGRREMMELLRIVAMPAADLLDDWFESDALKGALGARGVSELLQGPRSGGTAFVLLHQYLGSTGGLRGRTVVRGGAGRLAEALAAAARAHGAEIRCGAAVARIQVVNGRASGVVLRDGSEIAASRVVSSAEPRHTLLTLADPLQLDPDFVRAVRHIRFRGVTARVHLALGELPRFRGMDGDAALGSTISIAPRLDYVERAYDDAKHGGVSGKLCLEASIPSLLDPGVSPAGRHAMSISVQYAPYRLNGAGWNAAAREALADAAIATLAEYAPELPGAILDRRVLSPADIEEHYGAPEGSLEHGEITLDQILFMRPVPGWAHYRTPVHGLFLCGAGTHPGGRVAGGAGRLAAAAMARDKVNASA